MAYTTWYLLSNAATYTPPSWDGSWDLDGTTTITLDPLKWGSAGPTTASRAEATATTPYKVGVLRAVSRRLAAQTINGTVNVCLGVSESNADADFYWRLHLYVIDADTDTPLGTLITYDDSGTGTEFSTTGTGKDLFAAQTLTPVVVPSGNYRLVAEIGYTSLNSHTTSRAAVIRYGAKAGSSTGNCADLDDLTVGSASPGSEAGFISFSSAISLASDVVPNVATSTATDLVSLPYNASQTVDDSGYTHTVWFKYTPAASQVLSEFAFGDLAVYAPTSRSHLSDLTAVDRSGDPNVPLQVKVTSGETTYFSVAPNVGDPTPAVLTMDVIAAPTGPVTVGTVGINDDLSSTGFPLTVIDPSDGTVLRFTSESFPAGEGGDNLPSGTMMWSDASNGNLQIFDKTFTLQATIPFDIGTSAALRSSPAQNRFYAGTDANPPVVKAYSAAGDELETHTLTAYNGLDGMASSNDGTILYHSRLASGVIRRWDLVNDVALSDLASAIGTQITQDIIVLDDDSILVHYNDFSGTGGTTVKRYNDGGTTLNTYTISASGSTPFGTLGRLARSTSDSSFYVWHHPDGVDNGLSRFTQVRVSDGATLHFFDTPEFEGGVYGRDPAAVPEARFGTPFSCAFMITQALPVPALDISEPCCPCDCPPAGPGGPGSGLPPPLPGLPGAIESHKGNILPPVNPGAWEAVCAGGGAVPTAADATDAESWVS